MLQDQTLIVFVGPPGSGKSELAKRTLSDLGPRLTHYDIDDIRKDNFGQPVDNDGTDPAIKDRDDREMAGTYNIMFGFIDGFLRAQHPLMITCTLSSKRWGQNRLIEICARYPEAKIRIIWCWPEITKEQLAKRFENRAAAGYVGATQSADRAWELRKRYEPIEIPHLKLDTGPRFTPEQSAQEALAYILG